MPETSKRIIHRFEEAVRFAVGDDSGGQHRSHARQLCQFGDARSIDIDHSIGGEGIVGAVAGQRLTRGRHSQLHSIDDEGSEIDRRQIGPRRGAAGGGDGVCHPAPVDHDHQTRIHHGT